MRFLGRIAAWAMVLAMVLTACSGGSQECQSHEDLGCVEGVTYWQDSCGNLEEIFERCLDSCNEDQTGCVTGCVPQTCAQLGKVCGDWDDGCEWLLECGDCAAADEICTPEGQCQKVESLTNFSFFVTSLAALRDLSGTEDGFGGDLRFGETGPGAGLRGADKICATIAERSMPGSSVKQWRAFLSVSADENGNVVHAADRIGPGPWYDRLGRLLAPTLAELLSERPENGDLTIRDDLPNEDGVPNHQPDPTKDPVDNHHMMTGSDKAGLLYADTATCLDWTIADGAIENGKPRCGLAWPRVLNLMAPPPGDISSSNWISSLSASGCAAGVGTEGRPPPGSDTVGAGGGYGGFYCFALEP